MREDELAPADGLTAITGETGAGKTILAQAIGLLLGAKGDAGPIGAAAGEAYVEAELDVPEGFFEDDGARRARRAARRRTSPVSCSRAASSPTGARGRTRGAARSPVRISPPRPSG